MSLDSTVAQCTKWAAKKGADLTVDYDSNPINHERNKTRYAGGATVTALSSIFGGPSYFPFF